MMTDIESAGVETRPWMMIFQKKTLLHKKKVKDSLGVTIILQDPAEDRLQIDQIDI